MKISLPYVIALAVILLSIGIFIIFSSKCSEGPPGGGGGGLPIPKGGGGGNNNPPPTRTLTTPNSSNCIMMPEFMPGNANYSANSTPYACTYTSLANGSGGQEEGVFYDLYNNWVPGGIGGTSGSLRQGSGCSFISAQNDSWLCSAMAGATLPQYMYYQLPQSMSPASAISFVYTNFAGPVGMQFNNNGDINPNISPSLAQTATAAIASVDQLAWWGKLASAGAAKNTVNTNATAPGFALTYFPSHALAQGNTPFFGMCTISDTGSGSVICLDKTASVSAAINMTTPESGGGAYCSGWTSSGNTSICADINADDFYHVAETPSASVSAVNIYGNRPVNIMQFFHPGVGSSGPGVMPYLGGIIYPYNQPRGTWACLDSQCATQPLNTT